MLWWSTGHSDCVVISSLNHGWESLESQHTGVESFPSVVHTAVQFVVVAVLIDDVYWLQLTFHLVGVKRVKDESRKVGVCTVECIPFYCLITIVEACSRTFVKGDNLEIFVYFGRKLPAAFSIEEFCAFKMKHDVFWTSARPVTTVAWSGKRSSCCPSWIRFFDPSYTINCHIHKGCICKLVEWGVVSSSWVSFKDALGFFTMSLLMEVVEEY